MIDHSYCSMAMGGSCACCGTLNIEVEESTELGARSRPRVSECQRRRDRKGTRRVLLRVVLLFNVFGKVW